MIQFIEFARKAYLFVSLGLLLFFSSPGFGQLELALEEVASGFRRPVLATHAGDGSGRMFVVEQHGRIFIVDASETVLPAPFLDLSITGLHRVNQDGGSFTERGLLGLAFHPNYAQAGMTGAGKFYVCYTRFADGASIVSEFSVSADPNIASPTERIILGPIVQPESNHNGGMIAFSPVDGFLYVGLGDGGGSNDRHGVIGNGQDTSNFLGTILRIDVDSTDPGKEYAVPVDNPFVGLAPLDEIYAYGLRNPWRFSFDRQDGRLFAADVGQGAREEVDLIESGKNYGWRCREGFLSFNETTPNCASATFTDPIDDYPRSLGTSITGGYVYRGLEYPNMEGLYFFGDWGSGRIWSLETGPGNTWTRTEHLDTSFKISGFGEDESGEVYCLYHSFTAETSLYRLVDDSVLNPTATPTETASPTHTPTVTRTPTETATPTNTPTPTVSPSSTPSPTVTLEAPTQTPLSGDLNDSGRVEVDDLLEFLRQEKGNAPSSGFRSGDEAPPGIDFFDLLVLVLNWRSP